MRATTVLVVVAVAAFTGGALDGPSQQAADAAPESDQTEYRGELYPNPETGCIGFPEEPGSPRLWPDTAPQGQPDAPLPSDATDPPGMNRLDGMVEKSSDDDLALYRRPWPLCEDPAVFVMVTEEGAIVVDAPDEQSR